MTTLIFGCGYLGSRVAERWRECGYHVVVVTRSAKRRQQLEGRGFEAVVADIGQDQPLPRLPEADLVLFAVGFDRTRGQSIGELYTSGLRNALSALTAPPRAFVYASTTGVYGDAGGDWVDETTPPLPQREGARASHNAEQIITDSDLAGSATILRLAGLYGPGRVPYLDQLRAGEPLQVPVTGWLNLIHVDDAATASVAAARASDGPEQLTSVSRPRVINVVDCAPVQRDDYYREVARAINAEPPQFVATDSRSPAAGRAQVNRRIRNERMRRLLGVKLCYPSYREGLNAILRADATS